MSPTFLELLRSTTGALELLAILVGCLLSGWGLVLLAAAALEARAHRPLGGEPPQLRNASPSTPRVSILVSVRNERATIVDRLRAIKRVDWSNLEVVVVNDGSRDGTLDELRSALDLVRIHAIYRRTLSTRPIRGLHRTRTHPNLIVVDKEQGGRANALNAALDVATGDLVCALEPGATLEPDAVPRLVAPFLDHADTVAAAGAIGVANGSVTHDGCVVEGRVPLHAVAGFQLLAYLRTSLFARLGWNRLGGNLDLADTVLLYRRASLLRAGGFERAEAGADSAVIARLFAGTSEHRAGRHVHFLPEPVAWTLAPQQAAVIGRQHAARQRALAVLLVSQCRKYFHVRGAPSCLLPRLHALTELFAPVIELAGLLALLVAASAGVLNGPLAALLLLTSCGLTTVHTLAALVLEELVRCRYTRRRDKLLLLCWALLENLGYRQLLQIWRARGLFSTLRRPPATRTVQQVLVPVPAATPAMTVLAARPSAGAA